VNGSWEDFRDKKIELQPTQGRDSLLLIFKNETNRGGLMNIDSLTFE
jgi:hypothetical protein